MQRMWLRLSRIEEERQREVHKAPPEHSNVSSAPADEGGKPLSVLCNLLRVAAGVLRQVRAMPRQSAIAP